jgi:translation initiation factor 3 subunit A
LKAVSGESTQDRTDRDLLAPWLKFVWESYKQCLDLLKNNNKVETIYQQVAKRAFGFCVKYQRKTEFRKLCETIRQHMVQSQKYGNQLTSIDLNKPETQNNHLETRLCQLNHAISMELWQEAYKAVEDIYSLMNLSRQKPKPGQMFNYYSKLSLIFWKAGNHLFHAATLQKLFILIKEQKKAITSDELKKISTRLLLATLAIPIPPNRSSIDEYLDQDDITQEKLKRLSSLLNLQQPPTRVSLLKDLTKYNVVQHVYVEIRELYKWLEVDFHPLKLSDRVKKCLDSINTSPELQNEVYSQYVPAIKDICVIRLLKQIAQIYTTIEIQRFIQLAPVQMDPFQLEKLIVDAAKQLDLQVRINHQTKSLQFGNDLYVAQKDELPEGPNIQSMPSELFRNQLITMTEQLQQAHELICGAENKKRREETALNIAHVYRQTADKHHMDLLRRRQLIEEQKEMYERLVLEREQAEAERQRLEKDRLLAIPKSAGIQRDGQYRFPGSINEIDDRDRVNEEEDIALKKQIEQANREKKELAER